MPTNTRKKTAQQGQQLIINQILLQQIDRTPKTVADWMGALRSAESRTNPIRKRLYDMYSRILLDAHLQSIYQKRIRNVKNAVVEYYDEGKDTTEQNRMLKKPWFLDLLQYIVETQFWGHTLVETTLGKDGLIEKVHIIPRVSVRPELGIVTETNYAQQTGIRFREAPYDIRTVEIEATDKFGLLNYAAVNTLLKAQGTADFATYVELFGSPIREIMYDPSVPGAKAESEEIGRQAGNSAVIVLPRDQAELKLHQQSGTGSQDLHVSFLEQLKKELTILVLGQSSTTDEKAFVGAAQVHANEQEQITKEDKRFAEFVLNEQLLPKLIALGYPLSPAGCFKFMEETRLSIQEQLDIDLKLNQVIEIAPDYFYDKYNIPKPATGAGAKQPTSVEIKSLYRETAEPYPFGGACCS